MQLRRCFFTVSFLIGCMPFVKAQTTSTPQYIAMYKDIAIDEMKRSGIPASITLAQGVLETQSGNSWLVQNSNNHFGIKCKNNWTGQTVNYDDDARQECFRKYNTAAESYKDHSDFLKNNPRYSFLFQFQMEDYKSWAYGLKQAGYATSKTYPQQLIKVIEDYNLQQYTMEGEGLVARSTPSTSTTTTKPSTTTTGKSNTAAADKPIPSGVFEINGRKVLYAQAGTALIQLADEKDIKLRNLVKYNDLANDDPLPKSNYIFLEKKGKTGKNDFHVVKQGETMYDISQAEGIQLRWLRRRNRMKEGEEPAAGQRLALQGYASTKPDLAKIPPPEDPTEGDLNPKQIVDDVKTEMERQQQVAQQQQAQQQQAQSQQQVNKLPDGMVDDLKKIGDVTPAGTSTNAGTTAAKPAATANKPSYNPAPATTATKPSYNPAPTATTTPTTTSSSKPTYNPAPPVATGSVTATTPAATTPATPAPAPATASTPAAASPAPVGPAPATASTPAPVGPAPATASTPAAASPSPAAPAPATPTSTPATASPAPVAPAPAPATSSPVATTPTPSPAQPAATTPAPQQPSPSTTPGGLPEGTIQVGNLLYHDVTSKETLYGISKRYNVTVEQLREWNQLEAYDIKIGQRLLVGKAQQ